MMKAERIIAVSAVFSLFATLAPIPVNAASSSVSLSIHFEVAPSELFRAPNIEPAKIRTCRSMKTQVDTAWRDQVRRPVLTCSSPAAMPLIITNDSPKTLVVRP